MINRRKLSQTCAATVAVASASLAGCSSAHVSAPTGAGKHTSFGSLKRIDAGVLNIGYAEAGPADGPAVILLHGWPYDIYSYVDVVPVLASAVHDRSVRADIVRRFAEGLPEACGLFQGCGQVFPAGDGGLWGGWP